MSKSSPLLGLVFFTFALCAFAPQAHADCAAGALWTHPRSEQTLAADGGILLYAYGTEQAPLLALVRAGELKLVRTDVKRDAKVVELTAEIRSGDMSETQVWLHPRTPLAPGQWRLSVPAGKVSAARLNALSWTVSGGGRSPAVAWRSGAEFVETTYQRFGCGPAAALVFVVDLPDGALVEVAGTVTTGNTRASLNRFLYVVNDGHISVGHGMCSGGHAPHFGSEYAVRLIAYNAAGHPVSDPHRGLFRFVPQIPAQ